MENSIFIPHDVPSMKNSKRITRGGNVRHSKAVEKYLHAHGIKSFSTFRGKKRKCWTKQEPHVKPILGLDNTFLDACGNYFDGIQYPARIGFHFVRKTKGAFDYINIAQIILDLLTAHGLIYDDDMRHVVPVFIDREGAPGVVCWTHDKNAPGVFVKLL